MALAVVVAVAVSGWQGAGGCDGERTSLDPDSGRVAVGPDLPLLAGLEGLGLVAEEPGDEEGVETIKAAASIVAVAEPSSPPAPAQEAVGEHPLDESMALQPIPTESRAEEAPRSGLWLTRTYRCLDDSTGAYCFPDLTASGVPVQPGVAACEPGAMGGVYEAGGRLWTCADTGLFSGYDVLEIWCHSIDHWGYPGSPEYEEPCPNLCEVEIEGRCYAEVRVVK